MITWVAIGIAAVAASLLGFAVYQLGALILLTPVKRKDKTTEQLLSHVLRRQFNFEAFINLLRLRLLQAGLKVSVEAYIGVSLGTGIAAGWLIGSVLHSPFVGVASGLGGSALPYLWVMARAGRRKREIRDAAPEVMRVWTNLIRSHRGQVRLALERSVETLPPIVAEPVGHMMHRLATEPTLAMEEAVEELTEILANKELGLFLKLALMGRRKGADIHLPLSRLTAASQATADLRADVAADLSGAATEGYMLAGVAVGIIFMMALGSPEQWELAMSHPSGWALRLLIILGLAGSLWAQRQVTKLSEVE